MGLLCYEGGFAGMCVPYVMLFAIYGSSTNGAQRSYSQEGSEAIATSQVPAGCASFCFHLCLLGCLPVIC